MLVQSMVRELLTGRGGAPLQERYEAIVAAVYLALL